MTESDDARRARQRANSAAYRARQKAAAQTKKPRGAEPHGGGVVQRAQAQAQGMREARLEALRKLPDVRSIDAQHPEKAAARIRPVIDTGRTEGPPVKTKAAQERRAAAIRDRANAERLQRIGRARKNSLRVELTDGPVSEQLQEMNPEDRRRFASLTERIAAGSAQAVAILFEHAGGQKLYSAAIERILYEKDRASGFDMLEALAEYADRAAEVYSPRAMRELGLGDRNGQLRF